MRSLNQIGCEALDGAADGTTKALITLLCIPVLLAVGAALVVACVLRAAFQAMAKLVVR
jgi:hypothetical protein